MRFPERTAQTSERRWERRFAMALIALFGLATLSVVATTSALSRDHATRIANELPVTKP